MGCLMFGTSPTSELSHKEPNSAEPPLLRLCTNYMSKEGSFRKDYDVIRVISPSEHRRVLEVRSKRTQEVFVLKEVTKTHISATEAGSLLKEVQVLSRLSHPNLIRLQEVYEDKNKYFIVSELMQGGELYDFIVDSEFLTEGTAATIMLQLLSAVAYCHQNSVVLRNIKPENIFLSSLPTSPKDIHIKLVDFGMSTVISNNRHLHKLLNAELYTAPEVFKGDYNEACDMWSLGCVLYALLCGETPFSGETSEEICAQVTRGELRMNDPKWDAISEKAKDLVRSLLAVNPVQRITAQQALKHPWITAAHVVSQEDSLTSKILVNNLKKFNGEKKLKQALGSFITDRFLSKEQIEEQRRLFQALDQDHSGTLTRNELIEALASSSSTEEATAEVDSILANIDCDKNGVIDYEEFLTAVAIQKNLLSKQMVEKAFNYLDADHNGKISAKELNSLLGQSVEQIALKKMIKEADKNGDGQLNLKEFTNLILQE